MLDFLPNDIHRIPYVVEKLWKLKSEGLNPSKSYQLSNFYVAKANCPLQMKTD